MGRAEFDVIVLGAGITGITTAYMLAREGRRVCVLERRPQAALETTFANGGQISVSHAEPWAHPGALRQVLKWLPRKESPLFFSPRMDWRQWVWLAGWLWECRRQAAEHNTVQIVDIALRSRELYREVREKEGISYQERSLGILHFYRDPAEFDAACRMAELMTRYGCTRVPVTKAEIDRLEPALAPQKSVVGGTFTREDESGNARLFTQELARICENRYGVRIVYNTAVDRLVPKDGRIRTVKATGPDRLPRFYTARHFVLCLGPWSPLVAQQLGLFLNIYPAKGYSISIPLDRTNAPYAPRVSLTDDENKLVLSNLMTHLRVAGTAELAGWDASLRFHRIRPLVMKTAELFPGVFERMDFRDEAYIRGHFHPWAGLRPATPSNLPYVGRSQKFANLWLNTGHGTLGWTMGMGTAETLKRMVPV